MHGRRKAEQASRSEAEKVAQQAKVLKYQQLATLALARRKQEGATPPDPAASLQLSGQLLRVNPDVYTLWNHRKEIIHGAALLRAPLKQPQPEEKPGAAAAEAAAAEDGAEGEEQQASTTAPGETPAARGLEFLEGELALVAECIQKNPKSYGAWHHRRWLFEQAAEAGLGGREGLAALLAQELQLCTKLLDADERNFHCWNYRRFVAGLHPTRTASDEFAFSTERIYKNFSNYSAFHHRTTYVPDYLREAGVDPRDFVRAELEMVQQAIFTEPDDQTAWWYHQYLVAFAARAAAEEGDPAFLQEMLRGEVAAIQGLLEESSDYRWAVLTLAALLRRLASVVKGEGEGEGAELLAESEGLYKRLVGLDPDHARRYRSILAQK